MKPPFLEIPDSRAAEDALDLAACFGGELVYTQRSRREASDPLGVAAFVDKFPEMLGSRQRLVLA